jgi:HAD superfamily hydrolase (TIGR01509 family)
MNGNPLPDVDPHGWATRRRQSVRRAALGRGADPRAPRIAAVLLDIGGVIVPQLFESVRRPGFPRGPFGGDERYRAVQRGELSERDYWAEVAAEEGVDVGALWREHTYVREDMHRALGALASRVRLVAFTNDMSHWFGERWAARYPVFALFDQLIEAARLGPPKPDPEAFVRAAAAIGEPVERCLFVDDLRANIEGARAVGMPTRYFDVRDPAGSLLALLDDLGLAALPPAPDPRGRAVRAARVPRGR